MPSSPLPLPCLSLITRRALCPDDTLVERVSQAVKGGVHLVQLREKDLPAGELLRLARELRKVTRGRALLFVNGRLDVALACEADGVHLPEDGLPAADARRVAGPGFLIGRSVHGVQAALQAEREGADLVQVGTVFPSRSHPGGAAGGAELVKRVVSALSIPVLGVGGIDAGNVAEVLGAGAQGIAVISAILAVPDTYAASRKLRQALEAAWLAHRQQVAR